MMVRCDVIRRKNWYQNDAEPRRMSMKDVRLDAKLMRRPLLPLVRETSSSEPGPSRESTAPTRSSSGENADAGSLVGGGGVARGENT